MGISIVPSCGTQSPPHVVVIGNQKGGSGKSTFAMHIIVALLKAGKRVASFDLDLNQLTLTRYLSNRREWDRAHELKLELPDHYPLSDEIPHDKAWSHRAELRQFISKLKKIGRAQKRDLINGNASSHNADLRLFISQLKKIEQAHKHDFIVIDTHGGVQHLSLIAHGLADTLITPVNDSLLDLDVLVAIEQSDLEPQPSVYAKTVRRALDARRRVSGPRDRLDCRSKPPGISLVKQSAPDQSGLGRDSNDSGISDCTRFVGATCISRVFRLRFDGVRPGRCSGAQRAAQFSRACRSTEFNSRARTH
jgi:cellulose biosynthesis protein BcsQ